MAAEVGSAPVNGYGHGANAAYAGDAYRQHQSAPSTASTAPVAPSTTSSSGQSDISREQVAWYFVESYYTTMSQTPEKLHLFFNKRSQLVSGVEEEKSSVASGQKAIKERLAELDFQDCKVRVTNVDSQGSDSTIVIQVIGEMSNKSQPHRKFVQTFVLASQTNGYFVLNDIFRYIKDDVDEEEQEQNNESTSQEEETHPAEGVKTETVESEGGPEVVDKKLEEVAKAEEKEEDEEEATADVNGEPTDESADADADETPAAAVSAPDASKTEEVEEAVAQEDIQQPERPQDPAPTPKAEEPSPAPAAATPAAPPKPAVPRSWAQLAAGNQASKAAAASATRQAPAPTPSSSSSSQPKAAPAAPQAPAAPAASAPAPREASPDSNKEGSTGGWQTAGADHTRKQSKPVNTGHSDGRVRAFVKNVTEDVDAEALKTVLAKFGEVVYFDVARQKKAAFVEYKTVAGFQAAVNANPHRVGSEEVWVEERRVNAGGFAPRGGARGGRGGYEGRGGAPRGGFGGSRGGRGGSGNVTPRGGRGGAQA